MCALSPWAAPSGFGNTVHIRQITHAHVTTIKHTISLTGCVDMFNRLLVSGLTEVIVRFNRLLLSGLTEVIVRFNRLLVSGLTGYCCRV